MKVQFDQVRKEQERLLMQIKSLLSERERNQEELKKKQVSNDNEGDRMKGLENKLA